jgi:hypothetical protein
MRRRTRGFVKKLPFGTLLRCGTHGNWCSGQPAGAYGLNNTLPELGHKLRQTRVGTFRLFDALNCQSSLLLLLAILLSRTFPQCFQCVLLKSKKPTLKAGLVIDVIDLYDGCERGFEPSHALPLWDPLSDLASRGKPLPN